MKTPLKMCVRCGQDKPAKEFEAVSAHAICTLCVTDGKNKFNMAGCSLTDMLVGKNLFLSRGEMDKNDKEPA